MSFAIIVYLVGMALVFVGERLVADIVAARWVLDLLGAAALIGSFILRWRRLEDADNDGLAHGERVALALQAVGSGSLLFYVLSTDGVVQFFNWTATGRERWQGIWGALWPIVWLLGTVPLMLVDRAVETSPVVAPPQRIKRALSHGLAVALGVALVFPVNYIAARHRQSWDLAYFRAARAGSATKNVVKSLTKPVDVRVFVEPDSTLRQDLQGYFDALEGDNLHVTYHDQAGEPELARKLHVRENGQIAFTAGPLPSDDDAKKPTTKILRLGSTELAARHKLRDLDNQVRKTLLAVGRGTLKIYLTVGHGEMQLDGSSDDPTESLKILKQVFDAAQFDTANLSADNGLAKDIPDDADAVMILGPKQTFMPSEIDALKAYLDRGGALFIAMLPRDLRARDPLASTDPPLGDLLHKLGVKMQPSVLAAERGIIPVMRNKTDKLNLITDQFSSHPSTAALSQSTPSLMLFTPATGYLQKAKKSKADVVITVRSHHYAWADTNGNLEYDPKAGEKERKYPLAAASEGSADAKDATKSHKKWRAMVVADAPFISDFGMRARGNRQFVYDTLNWLVHVEDQSGTIESEKDVRIRHSKEDQQWWFYVTVLGIPLLLLGAGATRIWWRKKGGEA